MRAVRIGRRVRVRRVDRDNVLAQGVTVEVEPQASMVAPAEAFEQLTQALECARRLLDRLSGAGRAELVEGLQQLTEAVAVAVETLSDDSAPPAAETGIADASPAHTIAGPANRARSSRSRA